MFAKVTVHKVVAYDVLFVWAVPCCVKDFDVHYFQEKASRRGFKVAFIGEFEADKTLLGLLKEIKLDLRKYDFDKDLKFQIDLIDKKFSGGFFLDCELGIVDNRGERFPVASLSEIEEEELQSCQCSSCKNLIDEVVNDVVH